MDLATEQIQRLLRQRHHILPPYEDNDDFAVRSQTGLIEAMPDRHRHHDQPARRHRRRLPHRRRHRHHEHHARLRLRAHPRDRPAQGRRARPARTCASSSSSSPASSPRVGGLLGVGAGRSSARSCWPAPSTSTAAITITSVLEAVGVATADRPLLRHLARPESRATQPDRGPAVRVGLWGLARTSSVCVPVPVVDSACLP